MADPFLKWCGSKRQLLPELRARMPPWISGRYFEPFVGGGALLFDLAPDRAVISDVNEELLITYETIRDLPEETVDAYKTLARRHSEAYYYEVRAMKLRGLDPCEVAGRMLYLNRTCFNGLCRVNRAGDFNVPSGQREAPALDEENLHACSRILRSVTIVRGGFEVACEAAEGDVAFLDPPYIPLTPTANFTAYAGTFGDAEQVKLRDLARDLKRRGVHVVLSNSSAPRVFELYADGFTIERVAARRRVSAKGAGRATVDEVLIT